MCNSADETLGNVVNVVQELWTAKCRERHDALRQAYGERFPAPFGATRNELEIAESELLANVAKSVMFLLDTLAEERYPLFVRCADGD